MDQAPYDRVKIALLLVAVLGLFLGIVFYQAGQTDVATIVWFIGVMPVLIALLIEILRSLSRGDVGLDIIAALSMAAALAFGETLAAAVVAVMYSGGTFLEIYAEGRARREMHDLLSRVPHTATRHNNGGLEVIGSVALIFSGSNCPCSSCHSRRSQEVDFPDAWLQIIGFRPSYLAGDRGNSDD